MVMQSSNDCAIGKRQLPIPVGLDRYIVTQDGSYTVEAACFMGRGHPSPVTISVRDFGNEGRGGFPTWVSWCRSSDCDQVGHCGTCNQGKCEGFHEVYSI